MTIDSGVFLQLALHEFPELRDDFEFFDGLIYLNVGSFRNLTQEAIDKGDLATLKRCYALADRVRTDGDKELVNAIHVSYLEKLDFRKPKGRGMRPEVRGKCPGVNLPPTG